MCSIWVRLAIPIAGFARCLVSFSDLFGLIPDQLSLAARSGNSPLPALAGARPALLYAAWLAGFIWLYRPPPPLIHPARIRPTVLCRGVTG